MFVVRDVFVVVPVIFDEVDRAAAGMILAAMFVPVLLMAGRHVQVNRCGCNILRCWRNDDRLRVDDRRPRDVADVDLSVEPGLTNADRYADVSGKRGDRERTEQRRIKKSVHCSLLTVYRRSWSCWRLRKWLS